MLKSTLGEFLLLAHPAKKPRLQMRSCNLQVVSSSTIQIWTQAVLPATTGQCVSGAPGAGWRSEASLQAKCPFHWPVLYPHSPEVIHHLAHLFLHTTLPYTHTSAQCLTLRGCSSVCGKNKYYIYFLQLAFLTKIRSSSRWIPTDISHFKKFKLL